MEAYDALPPETRQLVRDSANDVSLGGKLQAVRQRGAPRPILTRLQKRGLMPYQVGEAGIVAEMVLDEFDQASAE